MTDYTQIIKRNGFTLDTISSRKLAPLLGCGETKARGILKGLRGGGSRAAQTGKKENLVETRVQSSDKLEITKKTNRIVTLEQLLEFCEVDPAVWAVKSFECTKWEGYSADGNGGINVEPLFRVKASFVPIDKSTSVEAVKAELERLKSEASKEIRKFNVNKKYSHNGKGNALEISIADLHSGKLAWGEETLGANYDHKIAARLYENAFMDILGRTTVPLEKIMIVCGNDIFHSDSKKGATYKGTPLDNDSRWAKNFNSVWDVVVKQVNTCLEVAPVEILMVPGNHDEMSVWHLGHSLSCFYNGNKSVKVDNTAAFRKYWQYGVNMVMATHGNDINIKGLPLIMATEMPAMFAASHYREIHLGHKHSTALLEAYGIRTRIIPSLSPADAWHAQSGYVNNVRAAQGFVWSKTDGLIEIKEHSVKALAE